MALFQGSVCQSSPPGSFLFSPLIIWCLLHCICIGGSGFGLWCCLGHTCPKIEQIDTGLQNILTASTQMHTNVQAGLCLCQTVSLTLRWSWNCEVHLGQVFLQLPLQLPWAHLVRKRQLAQQPYVTNFNWHGHGGVARQQQTCDTHH